jgi:hypothetical protein
MDATIAVAAAATVHAACWFLVNRAQPAADMDGLLLLATSPCSPAAHLSADLVLRFLPQVYRRAKAADPADRLATQLADILRHWPLSGVLADIDEPPVVAPAFDGHPGLCMLYAERLARHEKPAWLPRRAGLEYLELVYQDLGKDPAALIRAAQPVGNSETADREEGSDA